MKYFIENTHEIEIRDINRYLQEELNKTSLVSKDIQLDKELKNKIGMAEIGRILEENGMPNDAFTLDLGSIHLHITGNTITFDDSEIMSRFDDAYLCIFEGCKEMKED